MILLARDCAKVQRGTPRYKLPRYGIQAQILADRLSEKRPDRTCARFELNLLGTHFSSTPLCQDIEPRGDADPCEDSDSYGTPQTEMHVMNFELCIHVSHANVLSPALSSYEEMNKAEVRSIRSKRKRPRDTDSLFPRNVLNTPEHNTVWTRGCVCITQS